MSVVATKDRILDAAEKLFAADGLARTSLRAITAEAGVNVAAVHYHFGSKEELLAAVFERHVAPVNRARLAWLDRLETGSAGPGPAIESLLEAFLAPVIRKGNGAGTPEADLAQLFGRLWAEREDFVERLVREQFGEVARRFTAAFARALPGLEPHDLAWRVHFTIGVLTHLALGGHRFGVAPELQVEAADDAQAVQRAVTFLAAGFRSGAGAPGTRATAAEGGMS
jgi:AcrR family transcriptional regulator